MDDVSEELSEIDRALADALDVTPSPHFEARLRRRIASEPGPVSFWNGRRMAFAAVAATALLAAIGGAVLSSRSPSTPTLLTARSLSVGAAPSADVRASVRERASDGPQRASRTRVAPPAAIAASEPEVLVPPEEIELYRRLIATAANVPHALVVEGPQDIVSAQRISEISIDPIKIDLIVPPVGGEGDRQ